MNRAIQIIILISCSLMAEAAVYKWTDEQGRTHYGDRPADEKTEQITIAPVPKPGNSAADLSERDEKRRRLLEVYREDRLKKQAAADRQKQEKAEKKQKCQQAKRRYERFNHAGGIYDKDKSGERRYLEHDERQQYITELQAAVEYWCGR